MKPRSSPLSALLLVVTAAWRVQAGIIVVEPDDFASGTDISGAYAGVVLSLLDPPGDSQNSPASTAIFAWHYGVTSTGSRCFAFSVVGGGYQGYLVNQFEMLKAEFSQPATFVSIDFVADDEYDPGVLEAHDAAGVLLDRVETPGNVGRGFH